MTVVQLYIDGKYVDATSSETFRSINPATGETLYKYTQTKSVYVQLTPMERPY